MSLRSRRLLKAASVGSSRLAVVSQTVKYFPQTGNTIMQSKNKLKGKYIMDKNGLINTVFNVFCCTYCAGK